MTDETTTLQRHDEIPEICPECGNDYRRTWIDNAKPLGREFRTFEHETHHQTEYCRVLIAEADE